MSDPQIYTLENLRGKNAWVTIRDCFDANEALDLLAASTTKQMQAMERRRY